MQTWFWTILATTFCGACAWVLVIFLRSKRGSVRSVAGGTNVGVNRKALLWVEDDPFIRQRISPKLEDAGFTVVTAHDADSAMTIFARQGDKFDLAILDVMMPGGRILGEKATMGGFETGVALARWMHERNSDLPLVAFSLSTERDATEWFLQHGAAFVEKSYDGTKLIDCVKTLLAGKKDKTQDETEAFVPLGGRDGQPVPVGHRLGRYEIRTLIGHGAMGNVYLAWDDELRREVAIKSPRPDRFKSDDEMTQFLEEARTVAKLRHPNIVSVYDIWRAGDGTPFVVMEYVEGGSLRKYLDSNKPTYSRIRTLLAPVADALRFAHAAGFVHRDVKPSNILIDKAGNSRLADFGLAIDERTQGHLAGQIAGTIPYMAPEQVRGETHRLDGRTDIWALGVVLYEMLVGRRPFGGDDENGILEEILNREPKPPRMIDDSVPVELERICLKCLRKSVVDRYATAGELISDLHGRSGAIDWESALKAVGGDSELLGEMLLVALEEFPRFLSDMRKALSAADARRCQKLAHTLKAHMIIMGARAGAELAYRMEVVGHDNELAEGERLFPAFEAEVNRVIAALAEGRPR